MLKAAGLTQPYPTNRAVVCGNLCFYKSYTWYELLTFRLEPGASSTVKVLGLLVPCSFSAWFHLCAGADMSKFSSSSSSCSWPRALLDPFIPRQDSAGKGNIIFSLNMKRAAALSLLGVDYPGCLLPFEESSPNTFSNSLGPGAV